MVEANGYQKVARGKKGIQGTHLPSAASRLSHVWGAPATEPDTGNMSLHGWLEAAGRKAQLWEAGTQCEELVHTDLLQRWAERAD